MGFTNCATGFLPEDDPALIYSFEPDGIKSAKGGTLKFKTKPYAHQLECLRRFGNASTFALLAEMGTGKTWIAINNYAFLLRRGLVKNMLVVAPNGVQWNWTRNELPAHLPDSIRPKVAFTAYASGLGKRAHKQLDEFLENAKVKPSILCVNWESLSHKSGRDVILQFLDAVPAGYNMAVLDESDYAKNPTSSRAKFLKEIKARTFFRRIMTGTVITNSPFDVWTQFEFLDSNILQCPSFYAFKLRHGIFYPKDSPIVRSIASHSRGTPLIQQKDRLGRLEYKNLDLLQRRIKPFSFSVKKADCLDLPAKVYQIVYVELTKLQEKVYQLAKQDGLLYLQKEEEQDVVPLDGAMAIATQLSQITGNHARDSEGNRTVVDPEHNPKLEKAMELLHAAVEGGSSVIVWARYVAEIEDLLAACKKEGLEAVSYYGATTPTDRQQALERFQAREVKVFIANPQSGGTGLTLTAANVVIYYSNSYRLHDRLQSEDRCHRIGQTRSVTYIDLVAENTLDENVLTALKSKLDVAKLVTDWKTFLR